MTFVSLEIQEARKFEPKNIFPDSKNQII
jgi:hypothetical protein